MDVSARERRERDLVTYYDNEVRDRAGRELPAPRVAWREEFVALLAAERRGSVLEVGAGPGRDGVAFAAAGGGTYGPARYFRFRTDRTVNEALGRHGVLERWMTWPGSDSLHYQAGVLRTRS